MGEKDEGLEPHLWVVLPRRERAGGGGAMADCEGGKRGSHDGGVSCPIYKLEALEAKQTCSGRGRPGPGALDGEVAAGRGGAV